MVVFASSLAGIGVPALRHDWWWPVTPFAVHDYLLRTIGGWLPLGIGTPNPYPGAYLLTPILAVLFIFPPQLALWAFGFLIALALRSVAGLISSTAHVSPSTRTALFSILIFNPWTYNELVAGHTFMLIGLAGLGIVAFEIFRSGARPAVLVAGVSLALAQLQFFALVVLLICVALYLQRNARTAMVAAILISLPVASGILLESGVVLSTPLSIAWERAQSVSPDQAFLLMGYFAGYAHAAWPYFDAGMLILVTISLFEGLAKRRGAAVTLACAAVGLAIATGLKGPLAQVEIFLFDHARPFGLFRELYDLLGGVLLCYLGLAAVASRRRGVAPALIVVALVLLAGWLSHPPSRYWTAYSKLPHLAIRGLTATRFALIPAFSPLSFHGHGEGLDPDAYDRGSATVLNQYISGYPENWALTTFQRDGDSRGLAALGVSEVIIRPWFQTVDNALGQYSSGKALTHIAIIRIPGASLFSLADRLGISATTTRPGSLMTFIGDLSPTMRKQIGLGALGLEPMPSVSASAAISTRQWSDATLQMNRFPGTAQGLGGVFGSRASGVYNVAAAYVLAYVSGTLTTSHGHVLSHSTRGRYAWVATQGATGLRCQGVCVLAFEATANPNTMIAKIPSPAHVEQLTGATSLLPWIWTVPIPARSGGVLHFNERFDRSWIALEGYHALSHLRIDEATNGWILPKSNHPENILIFHSTSVIQMVAEAVGFAFLVIYFGRHARSLRQTRSVGT